MIAEKKKERSIEIPTASLADIAFLVLIFFIVCSTIDVDKGLTLVLPAPGETKEIRRDNISNLLVNASGQVMLDDQLTPLAAVKNVVRDKLMQNDKLIISLKTDRDTQYEVYIRVLDEVKQAFVLANLPPRISLAEPDPN